MANREVRKVFRYRDDSGSSQAETVSHWRGFRWTTGPVIVASVGPWGSCQVWAVSEAEGKRVIRHAAAIAGFNPDDPEQGEWIITSSDSDRYGRVAEVGVKVRRGVPWVSKREGPNGAPLA
jgi:hypothetical protein